MIIPIVGRTIEWCLFGYGFFKLFFVIKKQEEHEKLHKTSGSPIFLVLKNIENA